MGPRFGVASIFALPENLPYGASAAMRMQASYGTACCGTNCSPPYQRGHRQNTEV